MVRSSPTGQGDPERGVLSRFSQPVGVGNLIISQRSPGKSWGKKDFLRAVTGIVTVLIKQKKAEPFLTLPCSLKT